MTSKQHSSQLEPKAERDGPTLDEVIEATVTKQRPMVPPSPRRPILNRPLTGNGYLVRYQLRQLGCKWDGSAWYAPLAVADEAQRLIDTYRPMTFSGTGWEIPNGHDY